MVRGAQGLCPGKQSRHTDTLDQGSPTEAYGAEGQPTDWRSGLGPRDVKGRELSTAAVTDWLNQTNQSGNYFMCQTLHYWRSEGQMLITGLGVKCST